MSAQITLNGRLVRDPELTFTPSGKALVKFTVVTNKRTFDKQDQQWKESGTTFWACTAWDTQAESIAESLSKGDSVVVIGSAEERSWEQNGEKKSRIEVTAQSVAVDLKFNSAKVTRKDLNGESWSVNAVPAKKEKTSFNPDDVAPF